MGDGRTGHGAVGRLAVIAAARRLGLAATRRLALALLLPAALTGCGSVAASSVGPITGAAVGIGLGGVTANPLVAYAAGVGTQAAVTALQKYLSRRLHHGEQDNIAAAIGRMQPGQSASWRISYEVPLLGDDEHGDVAVTRLIANPLTTCKEAAFTVIQGHKPDAPRGLYVTTACQRSDGTWEWAEAEPAAGRWGFLQ